MGFIEKEHYCYLKLEKLVGLPAGSRGMLKSSFY